MLLAPLPVIPVMASQGLIEQDGSLQHRSAQGSTSFASWMNRPAFGVEVASP